ncbi:hypothetical protein WICPIJ_007171 [Wickerhamomyces pijperi]|uniref:Uncharacterized protein n=1 Tax=Wickerhamomyces pijperi TaxID=599730 RepID=A0A9P8Q250_WICPI|nr:hypothetical protein WICPIJ_007171 [Wickerhamomyces pijperi]
MVAATRDPSLNGSNILTSSFNLIESLPLEDKSDGEDFPEALVGMLALIKALISFKVVNRVSDIFAQSEANFGDNGIFEPILLVSFSM